MNMLYKTYWALINKVTNKFLGYTHIPAQGREKGYVLISYFTEPFTYLPSTPLSSYHSMYWECHEIVRLFSERGYSVDIINAKDHKFIPKKPYAVCIDAEDDLERLSRYLPTNCKKVFYILISHWETYNAAENKRLDDLKKRRGLSLSTHRRVRPSKSAEIADFLIGFGNKKVFDSFSKFQKPIYHIIPSEVVKYDFPINKNFEEAKKHFMWIGGGGAVLKGLDITLEAFTKIPDLHLHICGPIYGEKDFTDAYRKELEQTPNIHVYGRLPVTGSRFHELINKCAAVVYPSGGDGTAGAIIQAMHAGLIPIITAETGIEENCGYIPLENPSPESIIKTVKDFCEIPPEELKNKSQKIWNFARSFYTKENFTKSYVEFMDKILKI
jgi:hypothetical protein